VDEIFLPLTITLSKCFEDMGRNVHLRLRMLFISSSWDTSRNVGLIHWYQDTIPKVKAISVAKIPLRIKFIF
jgi:hypothetical protein